MVLLTSVLRLSLPCVHIAAGVKQCPHVCVCLLTEYISSRLAKVFTDFILNANNHCDRIWTFLYLTLKAILCYFLLSVCWLHPFKNTCNILISMCHVPDHQGSTISGWVFKYTPVLHLCCCHRSADQLTMNSQEQATFIVPLYVYCPSPLTHN